MCENQTFICLVIFPRRCKRRESCNKAAFSNVNFEDLLLVADFFVALYFSGCGLDHWLIRDDKAENLLIGWELVV